MRRRVDDYSIPIKDRTEFHSSSKIIATQCESILAGGANQLQPAVRQISLDRLAIGEINVDNVVASYT
jgi:hypothetical protein